MQFEQLGPEQLFELFLVSVLEDDVTEEDMLLTMRHFVKSHKREPNDDGRMFLIVNGNFFQATMIFTAKTKILCHLRVELGERGFTDMRSYARAKQMQAAADPVEGVKVEWNKGMLGTKYELVMKQFIGRPMEVAVSFVNLFKVRTVYFEKRELR